MSLGSYEMAREIARRASSSLEDFALDPHPRGDENLWQWVSQLLSGLAHPENLEELQIPYSLATHEPPEGEEDYIWKELDKLLSSFTPPTNGDPTGHRKFSNLKRLRICPFAFPSVVNSKLRPQRLAELLPSLLPQMWQSGVLGVSFSSVLVLGFVEDSDCWYHSVDDG
ncbi:hypothetical protein BDN72DRAFT_862114 [Pluteus cervinus]|uniref:Uncharacterized protein n=1 Tax=Pluteus cervinus TaxID=181527 RepID=A0ACD3AD34_9AGAR|nr:hypothetical protein BDN72DRAFT_862114 [Pluteus cervinus]